jgi:glycosyltransferase involved in cell wall biosynthesis
MNVWSSACAADKITLVPNGVQMFERAVDASQVRRALGADNRPIIAVVGQLAPWKGHATAIEAARLVIDVHPASLFILVGDDRFGDSPAMMDDLRRTIRKLRLGDAVQLLGHRSDVRDILSVADVLLHPAYPEAFGRVIVEAMAARCVPVALAGAHGPAEIIRDGIDGLLVSERTPASLARAVCRVLENDSFRRRLGEEGRLRAASLYDRSLSTRSVELVYESLAAQAY